MPDVMSLLTEHINLVVSLGEAYKNDPEGTRKKLDEVNAQVTAQDQKDLDEYKKKVESDPQLQEEMKKSSQEFADSYSANGDSSYDNQQAQNQKQPTVVNNYYNGYGGYGYYSPYPYPYWFGYPYWYSYAMWYPRPLYYYTGFYLGAGGNVVVVGMPSRFYSNWFFSYGYRRYPRYYGFCNTYYNTHRTIVNRVNVYNSFHRDVFNHFSRTNNVTINRNTIRQDNRINNFRNARPNNQGFRNSIHNNGNNFNHQDFNHFRANQFHQQNWQHVGGGNRGGLGGGGGGHAGGGGRGRH